jgi:hypothetical protein
MVLTTRIHDGLHLRDVRSSLNRMPACREMAGRALRIRSGKNAIAVADGERAGEARSQVRRMRLNTEATHRDPD